MLSSYNRPPVSISEQVRHLKSKGLEISDTSAAEKQLDEKGYYRLKAYLLPFRENGGFIKGTSLDQAVQLYEFDEKLRLLVFKHIQRIEIAVRTRFNEAICSKTENSFWYLDSSLFGRNTASYANTVNKLRSAFLESQETFARHFRDRYYNDYCSFYSLMPPSWMAIELMTFGNMLTLLNSVSEDTISKFKLDRWTRREIGPDKFKKLTNWIHCIRDVRNHCAHHNRLFNRNFPAPDGVKAYLDSDIHLVEIDGGVAGQNQFNRLYTTLAVMQVISKRIGLPPIGPSLKGLFDEHEEATNHLRSMGFPDDWKSEKLFF
ncbi:Abi family protein [Gymnodinialimonas ceratoperidinii]|uniref:Abi family protein n=1 Tax=Gymnodinialimonas ceratoperidinii TaxID=2856823 RepID=A0A8F6YD09_9RHOB|nr:Abi family protein [Gymnodinialimonas ceratoperidinii]QXT39910.1 Abi family protein [Gymnodinialimonas ceratoperidinii]